MQCTGGLMTAEFARTHPVHTLLSGPAGGAIAGAYLAGRLGFSNAFTMDMGGTSCDVTGIADGQPDRKKEFEIGGWAVQLPTIDVNAIGAGGGSIAWVDAAGALHVGPQSAGSHPGPACYGAGGTEPTVTDANLVLGRYNPTSILGGAMTIDRDAAYRAIKDCVADRLGLSVEAAAAGMLDLVNSHMMHAVRYVSIERARDPREFALVAFGGAGPAHAAHIAAELNIPTVIVPLFPGCNSAFGILLSDIRHDHVRTFNVKANQVRLDELGSVYSAMVSDALGRLRDDGVADQDAVVLQLADLRYHGQTHELSLPLGSRDLDEHSVADLLRRFHHEHEALYGHSFADEPVEFVNVRVGALGRTPKPATPRWGSGSVDPRDALRGTRAVYFRESGGFIDCPIYDRAGLGSGMSFAGPAIVEQVDSTTVVPPGFAVHIADTGDMLLTGLGTRGMLTVNGRQRHQSRTRAPLTGGRDR
jgi:N-methylhydantoinase A